MKEIKERTVEDFLKEGPLLDWYYGLGRTNTGITGVHYNDAFHQAFNGELSHHFGQWAHIGVIPTVFGLKPEQVEKYTPIIEQMHKHAQKVYELSGFWPEEIEAKGSALLTIFQGQKSAPFRVILLEPLSIE